MIATVARDRCTNVSVEALLVVEDLENVCVVLYINTNSAEKDDPQLKTK